MEREHTRVHEENKTEAGKVQCVRPDGPDDVGGPVGRRWGWPDKDGDGQTKMGTAGRRWVRTLTIETFLGQSRNVALGSVATAKASSWLVALV